MNSSNSSNQVAYYYKKKERFIDFMIYKYLYIIIISLSFSQIDYQIVSSDNNSIKFFSNEKEILNIECDTKSIFPCHIFNANTYKIGYEGFDGVINSNHTIKKIDFINIDSNKFPIITLPNNVNIYAFVKATAGATGHGTQRLYLINIDNGKYVTINSTDMIEPEWYKENQMFGYIQKRNIYMGWSANFPIGWTSFEVIDGMFFLDLEKFRFYSNIEKQKLLFKYELSKIQLTDGVLDLFRGRTLSEIDDYFKPKRTYQNDYNENIEKEKYDNLNTFIKYLYYSKKLNKNEIEKKIFPILEPEFLECCLKYKYW